MTKYRKLKRISTFLVALALIVSLVPFVQPPAKAVYGDNPELVAAINSVLTPEQQLNHNNVPAIDLRNRADVFGTVNVDDLKTEFPNLFFLYLDNTNTTSIIASPGLGQIVNTTYTNTFASSGKSFSYTGSTITYRESEVNLNISRLLGELRINGDTLPTGMISNVTVWQGSTTLYSGPANGYIPQGTMLSLSTTPSLTLDVTVAHSSSTYTIPGVLFNVLKSGYFLAPSSNTVYNGGSTEFTLTHTDTNGTPATFGSLSDYDFYLYVNAQHHLVTDVTINPGGTSIKIVITAAQAQLGGSTSATLQIYDAGNTRWPNEVSPGVPPNPVDNPGFHVQANITVQDNPIVNSLMFEEHNGGYVGDVNSGDRIYINGGTSIASYLPLTLPSYNTTTTYLLRGYISSTWQYIPERYKQQIDIVIPSGVDNDLAGEIVAVTNPLGGSERVLALVVTAKKASADTYTYSTPGTEPVNVILDNGASQTPVTANAFLNVNIVKNDAIGYKIYQIPSIYSGYTKQDIEDAITGGDVLVTMVAHYTVDAGKQLHVVGSDTPGATVVEDSTIYLVAAAYYQSNGQSFIVPVPEINGWYQPPVYFPDHYVAGTFDPILPTTMEAQVATGLASNFMTNTTALEVQTGPYTGADENALLTFAPNNVATYVDFNIKKISKEVIDYIIAPPSYILSQGGTVYDELLYEISQVASTPGYTTPGNYRLYDLNVECKDNIAIGGFNNYVVWTIYSNYTADIAYGDSVASRVSMSNLSRVWAEPTAANQEYIARATPNGGPEDQLAGTTVDMQYIGATKSSKKITLTLTNSTIIGLYLVFEDHNHIFYSSAGALYNANTGINEMLPAFEIPQGTVAEVYTVYRFSNVEFYVGMGSTAWQTYVANAANINHVIHNNISSTGFVTDGGLGGGLANPFRMLNGTTASVAPDNDIQAFWSSSQTVVTINSVDFNIISSAESVTESIHVIYPLITNVAADDGTGLAQVTNGATLNYAVGDSWDTAPYISRTGDPGPTSLASIPGLYTGSVALVANYPTDVVFLSDYELGFWNRQPNQRIWYSYTYTLNGRPYSVSALPPIGTPTGTYVVNINVDYPRINEIYLVAKDPVPNTLTLNALKNAGYISGANNEYTLPFSAYSTISLYPVVLNSRADLGLSTFTPPTGAIVVQDVLNNPNYYSYMKFNDFTQTGPWSVLSGIASDFIGTPKTDSAGDIYYEVLFTGNIDVSNYLNIQFDATQVAPIGGAPYSSAPLGAGDTLQVHHLPDKYTAFVVDLVVSELTGPSPYPAGATAEFEVLYTLSTVSLGSFQVATTYFDIAGVKNVMPGPGNAYYPTDLSPTNPGAYNVLRVEEDQIPATGSYSLASGGVDGNVLQFTANVPGTYSFKLYTYNNSGAVAPNIFPQYRLITFSVAPAAQTILWGQVDPLIVLPANRATITEVGTSFLDASALSAGMVKMAYNIPGVDSAYVEVRDAGGNLLAAITVTVVGAAYQNAVLNEATTNFLPKNMAHGESIGLYWEVTYDPYDSSGIYVINENITGWTSWLAPNGASLNLSGSMVTAYAGANTAITNVMYEADYNGIKTEFFFAAINPIGTVPYYNYDILDNTNASVLPVYDIYMGSSETLNVVDLLAAGAAVSGINQVDSSNISIVLPSGFGAGSSYFTISGLVLGTSTITVYPDGGGWVTLTVNVVPPPVQPPTITFSITTQPHDTTVIEPDPGVFDIYVNYTGTGTVMYQWFESVGGGPFVSVSSSASNIFTTGATDVTIDNGNRYYCVVTAPGQTALTSSTVTLYVTGLSPWITISGPTNQRVTEPAAATFTVSAVSATSTSLTYQWQRSTNGGVTWTNLAGETNDSYSTGATSTTMSGYQYRCVVFDIVGAAYSAAATLTVDPAPGGGGPGGGGGGGGAATTTTTTAMYKVTVNAGNNGKATSNISEAAAGTLITITIAPNSDYMLDGISAKTDGGVTVSLTKVNDTTYTFTMPTDNVIVTVTFKEKPVEHICPSEPYVDLDTSLWYHEYTDYVIANGIMQGTSDNPLKFEPNTNLSRAMMVQILYNMEGKPPANGGMVFDDVAPGAWYADAIAWASANEIVNGYGNGKYGPSDSITREQMATILFRYANYKGFNVSAFDDLSAFTDANNVSEYAEAAIHWAVGTGLVQGRTPTTIVPKGTATRAEVATIITRFCRANGLFPNSLY